MSYIDKTYVVKGCIAEKPVLQDVTNVYATILKKYIVGLEK